MLYVPPQNYPKKAVKLTKTKSQNGYITVAYAMTEKLYKMWVNIDPPLLINRITTGVNLITMGTKKCQLKRK